MSTSSLAGLITLPGGRVKRETRFRQPTPEMLAV